MVSRQTAAEPASSDRAVRCHASAVRSFWAPCSPAVIRLQPPHEDRHGRDDHRGGEQRAQRGGRQRLLPSHGLLGARPAQPREQRTHQAERDEENRETLFEFPWMDRSMASRATPPASSASAVRIHARNVRSLAKLKR